MSEALSDPSHEHHEEAVRELAELEIDRECYLPTEPTLDGVNVRIRERFRAS
ncbi:hypothetical protein [Salininema proteolyticum]|uniref:Uncharacterized protein n=1 Tax=Salininema proteolyticum TaxID=1607685 RepID=A0ABV8U3G2_9ACTN